MAPKPRPVTAKALQALLTRIGSASSGVKGILEARFRKDVTRSRLFALRPEWQARQSKSWGRQLRIISIDMGIKNLAYCDAEVDYPDGNVMNPTMDIIRWNKLDLVAATRDLRRPLPKPRAVKERAIDADEEVDPYSLSVLSQTAYTFIHKEVLQYRPDIILIERQRWRSSSSSAIQQWTVRVNTLEAMLWAILDTLRTERKIVLPRLRDYDDKRDYEIHGVDPKRVGHFWLAQYARAAAENEGEALISKANEIDTNGKKLSRNKAEKKAKIALLRSWMSTEPPSTAPTTPKSAPKISFKIGYNAMLARKMICLPISTRRTKRKASDESDVDTENDTEGMDVKKLDDITDCCLQAAAWIAWESNRLQLYDVWERKRGDDGNLPELDDDILREMVDVAGER